MLNTPPKSDPAHDLLQATQAPALDVFFAPKSVAVIGATETPGSVGRTLITNLIASPFGGTVYPVNLKRPSVLGIRAYPTIKEVPETVDLAVIVTPAPIVPSVIADCVAAGVKGAIVISAGFRETGEAGAELERQVLQAARSGGMRIVGPNCLGVMSPRTGLNATFAQAMARPGNVAFLSQSGALLTAVLDHAIREQIGFSAFASLGSMLDVGWGDLIDYLGNDPNTSSIVIYMESVGDARAFLSAAREVALSKPIIVIKAGRTSVGAKAAASHTGSLTGSDEVLDAAFSRVGVLRVDTIAEVFALTESLAKQPTPKGNRLTIVTNAGGPGVLATDALIGGGGTLSAISDTTMTALNEVLPAAWSHNNPIDVLGDAGADRYAQALELSAKDENTDGLLVILTPQAMTDPTRTAEYLRPYAKTLGKPILASWMGGTTVAAGEQILSDAGIPTFPYPDDAADVFNTLWRYSRNLRQLYETPMLAESGTVDASGATQLLESIRASGRDLLTEAESKQILSAYGIPTIETHIAVDPDSAVAFAERIGYPVVLKLHSETVTHKTDVGGVQLNLKDADAVRAAFDRIGQGVTATDFLGVTVQPMIKMEGYELILGASPDPQFGPVLLFGTGGQLVEVFKDRALALPPLNSTLARLLMEKTKIFTALQGVRGRPPVDIAGLEQVLVRFSQLVLEQPLIKEIDINPLLVSPERFVALDARVVLYGTEVAEADLPRPAIRPYPLQYISSATMRDGTPFTIRPIRPEDEPALVAFHETLSERSVSLRYYEPLALEQRVAHERLQRIAFTDYDREIALIALAEDRLIAVARLSRTRGGIAAHGGDTDAHFTLLVSDEFQNQGIGTILLERLVETAQAEGLRRIHAEVLAENVAMRRVCENVGFQVAPAPAEATKLTFIRDLSEPILRTDA
jgi:acetyltransferase